MCVRVCVRACARVRACVSSYQLSYVRELTIFEHFHYCFSNEPAHYIIYYDQYNSAPLNVLRSGLCR